MRVVGLTGGIATGKSTVSALLQQEGLDVVDCDEIAKIVVKHGRWGWRRVVRAFGPAYLQGDGELDRERLGALVFADPAARRRLAAATQLPILLALLRRLAGHWLAGRWVVVVDMPLLYETGAARCTRPNVVVVASAGVQLARLMARDGSSVADAGARIAAQMPLARKAAAAQVVVRNEGARGELEPQVRALAQRLRRGAWLWGLLTSPLALLAGVAALMLMRKAGRP